MSRPEHPAGMPSPSPAAQAVPGGAPPPRLLVIVSSDYGELGSALYFLEGLAGAAVTMLLPPPLLAAASTHAGPVMQAYGDIDDVLRVLDRERPAAVLLFSGSLLAIGTGLGLRSVLRLLDTLRQRGIPVVTSDPFVGLVQGPGSLRFADVIQRTRSPLHRQFWAWRLAWTVSVLQRRLRHCLHVYPAPIGRLHPSADRSRVPFFNPRALEQACAVAPDAPPTWVFVLSQVDCHIETSRQGDAFYSHLAQRLRDAVRLGRGAVLVAPRAVIDRLLALPEPPPARMTVSSTYDDFMQQLLAAEYAFFWNYYSFSILHRVLAARPVFFFGQGHMVNILPALAEAGIELFYQGWRPPLLPLADPLEAERLASQAQAVRREFRRITAGLGHAETPAAILRRLASVDQLHVLQAQA